MYKLNALQVTALYKFAQDVLLNYYYNYVEGLEKEHDELLKENRKLKRMLKQKESKSKTVTNLDYRELAIKLKKERDFYKNKLLNGK